MSELKQETPSLPSVKQRRKVIDAELLKGHRQFSETQRSVSDPERENTLSSVVDQAPSSSSSSSVSSPSESSSSMEDLSSLEDVSDDDKDDSEEKDKLSIRNLQIPPKIEVTKKARLWSYIKKSPLNMFRFDTPVNGAIEEDDPDQYMIDYVESNYSKGTSRLIKKLTNLYMMMCDPMVGVVNPSSKSKVSFTGN